MKCPHCDGTGEISLEGVDTGMLILAARKAKGWTQLELASAMALHGNPISRPQIANIETGRADTSLRALRAFADVLDVKMKELIP